MRNMLKTTTALIASLSMIIPVPVLAETAQASALVCRDGSKLPCLPGQEPLDANGQPVPDTTMSEAEQAAAKAAADAKAAEDAAAAQAAADAKAAEDAAAAQAAADAKAAEDAAAAQAAADAKAADAKAAEDAAAAQAAADANAAEDAAAAQAAADAKAADAKAAEDAAAAQAAADAKAAEDAAAAQAAADAKAAEDAAAAQAAADAKAAEDAAAAPDATVPAVTPALPVQPDAASGAAPVAAAAGEPVGATAADATAAPAAGTTVTEETVTKDEVRSSDQDFANKVNEAPVQAQPAAQDKVQAPGAGKTAAGGAAAGGAAAGGAPVVKKKGLTDTEKAILLGLGAVAVGTILSNNRKVELNSGDRMVVTRQDGTQQVIKDDDALIKRPGDRVRTETFNDGSTRTTVLRDDGSRIVTIRDAEYRVLRRVHVSAAGRETVLIDDTVSYAPVDVAKLPPPPKRAAVADATSEDALRRALAEQGAFRRSFSLAQIRNIRQVRELAPAIDLDTITFESGSAAISPDQARALTGLGRFIRDTVAADPREVFLIEGHTDAVGSAATNLALSDRRAESVALALTEYFAVPPENLVVQGYGEQFLKIDTQGSERLNRRAGVRRITDLLMQASN